MSTHLLQPFVQTLRTRSPEAASALFPESQSPSGWRRVWLELVQRPNDPHSELATWLVWIEGVDPALLKRKRFNAHAHNTTRPGQFWSEACTHLLAQALPHTRTLGRRRIAMMKLKALARAQIFRLRQGDMGAAWLKRFLLVGIGSDYVRYIPELLELDSLHEGMDGSLEVGLVWMWFKQAGLWPYRYDGILKHRLGHPGAPHPMFSCIELLDALPEHRHREIWEGTSNIHPDFLRLRNRPEQIVSRLVGGALGEGLNHQNDRVAESLVMLLRKSEDSCKHLAEHVLFNRPSSLIARALRLLAGPSCVMPLIKCLGSSSERVQMEAIRALGWLEPDVAGEALIEAFMLPENSLPTGASRDMMRKGAVEVLRIWLSRDAEGVEPIIARFKLALRGKSALARELAAVSRREGLSLWFAREDALWRAGLHWLAAGKPEPQSEVDRLAAALYRLGNLEIHASEFMPLLEELRDDPVAVVAAVRALGHISPPAEWETGVGYAARMREIFTEDFDAVMEHTILKGWVKYSHWYQRHAVDSGGAMIRLHLHFLVESEASMREDARNHLSADLTDEALRELGPLLEHRRAEVRREVVRCLGESGDPRALPHLSAALLKEKTQKGRGLIEQAIASCSPRANPSERVMGSYDPSIPPTLNNLLEQLREVIHEPEPTVGSWVRACDLLQRLESIESLEIGLDGLMSRRGSVSGFDPANFRRPWTWRDHGVLGKLGRTWQEPVWMPFFAFCNEASRAAFLNHWLPRLEEGGPRGKKLDPDLGSRLFVHYTLQGWAWCERHSLPLENLTVRVDGGRVGRMARSTQIASLQLVGGFGVQITQAIAKRAPGGSSSTQMTLMQVRVPKFHPLRSDPELGKRIYQSKIDLEHRVDALP